MPNPNYLKGVRKERKLVNEAKSLGLIAFRSAGSHSPIDVVVIDLLKKKINFIQCKPESMGKTMKKRIEDNLESLNGEFKVSFKVE